jgi:hypothetical protein
MRYPTVDVDAVVTRVRVGVAIGDAVVNAVSSVAVAVDADAATAFAVHPVAEEASADVAMRHSSNRLVYSIWARAQYIRCEA